MDAAERAAREQWVRDWVADHSRDDIPPEEQVSVRSHLKHPRPTDESLRMTFVVSVRGFESEAAATRWAQTLERPPRPDEVREVIVGDLKHLDGEVEQVVKVITVSPGWRPA
jgi:hypothetical protein